MDIMHIIPSLSLGGAEKFVIDICNELAKNRINKIYLCVLNKIDKKSLLSQQIASNVTIISLNKAPGFSFSMFYKVNRLIKNINPDMVHTHLRGLPYSILAVLTSKKPFVHTFHTLPHRETSNYIRRILYKILFKYFRVLPVSISQTVLKDTKAIFGERYSTMINNGVKSLEKSSEYEIVKNEVKHYKQSEDTKVFLAIGRVSRVKNYLMLINSVKELERNNEDIILIIIGSLTDDSEYADQCKKAVLSSENIFMLGVKANIGDYMYCADALCITSLYEGLPLVALEAMSMGKPVLATSVGGIPDVITDGMNGYLSKDISVESYKEILKKFIAKPLKNKVLIKKDFEKNYSMSLCMKNYYQLYKSHINSFNSESSIS